MITVEMKLKEPKKHSIRYDAAVSEKGSDGSPALVQSIYISKRAFAGQTPPAAITVTITEVVK